MKFYKIGNQLWVAALLSVIAINVFADTMTNLCGGPTALLNIIDRPTAAYSACVIPSNNVIIESGYQYQQLSHSAGYAQNLPEAELRLGLPANNEFLVLLPNYNHQSLIPHSGYSATTLGIKHGTSFFQNWVSAVLALFTLPDGSAGFGSKGAGVEVNGIFSYTFNPQFNMTIMIGGSSSTQSSYAGGQRYASINPDLVIAYSPIDKLSIYGEVYGQTKTSPNEGFGLNFDGGLIYLLLPNVSVDLELGQRITGNLDGFTHYIGSGLVVYFHS